MSEGVGRSITGWLWEWDVVGKQGLSVRLLGAQPHPLLQDMLGMHSPALGSQPQTLPKPEPEDC